MQYYTNLRLTVVKVESECDCELKGTYSTCLEDNADIADTCKCKPGFKSDEASQLNCGGKSFFFYQSSSKLF